MTTPTPYPYQADYLQAIRQGFLEFNRQLVVSPTGSGKTNMFSWLCEEARNDGLKSLVLVDQDELVWQAKERIERITGLRVEAEKAEWVATFDADVVVATVQSMVGRLDRWPADHFGLVIADEADKSITDQWQRVLTHFDGFAQVCGFTATPDRTDQRNLGCYYENVIEKENLFSLVDKGFLAPVSVHMAPIKIDLSKVRLSGGDYDAGELDDAIGPHLQAVAMEILNCAPFRKTLVFLPLVKTAEKFAAIARQVGLNAEFVHGKDPEREPKLKSFKNGRFDVLANSSLLTRGYDDPSIDCIVPCRTTKSTSLYWQILGRGTRLAPGKRDVMLFDFLYQAQKHLVCRPAHLISKNDIQANAITQILEERSAGIPADVAAQMPLDLQQVVGEATHQREEALRKQLEAHKNKKRKTVSAEEFAWEHGNLDAVEYEPVMAWESSAISERQEKYLKQAKIDLSTVRGRGHASKLLDIYFANKKPRLASPKAVALMRRMRGLAASIGITDLDAVTAAQAGRFFAALKEKNQNQELV